MFVCTSCGGESPQGFSYCGHCGAALLGPPQRREERKVVSVLFMDLVGFTARSETADPEDVRATLAPYHGAVKAEIERYGGVVEKFIGDAVMAVFGAPRTHEDDAERAVRAALAATDAIAGLNAAHPGLDLSARAAVNTGETLVVLDARPERGEAMVAGDVVNTASRLQQAAPAGTVVVGVLTYRSTRGAIDYEELPAVSLKGKHAPVEMWRAIRAHAAHYGVTVRPNTSMVGRAEELDLMIRTFDRARSHRAPQLVTVVGEPGVGKTRLVSEFRDRLGKDATWLQGRSLPYGDGITFWALTEIVGAACGILPSDTAEQARAKIRDSVQRVIQDASDRAWITGRLHALVGGDQDVDPRRQEDTFAAWTAYLRALAQEGPIVVAFEDLHWADGAMVRFASYLVEWAGPSPILVVVTARPELFDLVPTWGGGKHDAVTIALGPLSETDTIELVNSLLEGAVLPPEVRSDVLERIGGNPLYAEEFCAMLRDRRLLVRENERWVLASPAGAIPIPETLQALVAARIDTLEPDAKAVLEDAAVLGKVFWPSAICAIGGLEESDVRALLHTLATNEFVRPVAATSFEDEEGFSFWHVALRDVAYEGLPRAERMAKHLAAAAWIERAAGERVAGYAELLAHHETHARELALAVGDLRLAAELAVPAGRHLALAGGRAVNLDPERASAMLDRALALLPADDPERGRTLVRAMEAAERTGSADAVRFGEDAVAWFRARGDVSGQVGALWELGVSALEILGDTARGRALRWEAFHLAETLPPGPQQADAFGQIAAEMEADRPREALALAERAWAIAESSGSLRSRVIELGIRGNCHITLGHVRSGLADLRDALELARDLGDTEFLTMEYGNLANALLEVEGPAAALDVQRRAIENEQRRGGLTFYSMWGRAESTWMLFQLGRWDEVLDVARTADAYDKAHGETYVGLLASPQAIAVLAHRGDEGGVGWLEELLPRARNNGHPQVVVPMLTAAVLTHGAHHEAAEVRALARELLTLTQDLPFYRGWCAPDLARILVAHGDLEAARSLRFEPIGLARSQLAARTVDALLVEAEEDARRATELFAELAPRWRSFGNVVEYGHALLGWGRCLRRSGSAQEATDVLERAEGVFGGLGAASLAAESRRARTLLPA